MSMSPKETMSVIESAATKSKGWRVGNLAAAWIRGRMTGSLKPARKEVS